MHGWLGIQSVEPGVESLIECSFPRDCVWVTGLARLDFTIMATSPVFPTDIDIAS
jgi:hypothetical protein